MKWVIALVVLLTLGLLFWHWDFSEPVIQLETPSVLGKDFELSLTVEDEGRGIRGIQIWFRQAGKEFLVVSKEHPRAPLWENGPSNDEIVIAAGDLPEDVSLEEGELELVVEVTDQPSLWFFGHEVVDIRTVLYDSTPPRVEILSGQHYLRQGGSEAILYRLFEAGVRTGVQVGEHTYSGYPVGGRGLGLQLCLFALAYDQSDETPIHVWAEDLAGNRTETQFWHRTFPRVFRTRPIQITDRIIDAVSQDILANTTEVTEKETPIATFIDINDRFRKVTNRQLAEITSFSADRLLWSQPFLQLTNSKVESRFADHRIYLYEGNEVDRQTHLGFDLASVAQSPVEASNDGIVAFTGYLGIYGNTVVLDHGLGLFSLYGHLSSIGVDTGQNVARGAVLGRTGQSGLAAGDHLHFSMLLGEVQVTPLEWWDPKWVQDHVLSKWDAGSRQDP